MKKLLLSAFAAASIACAVAPLAHAKLADGQSSSTSGAVRQSFQPGAMAQYRDDDDERYARRYRRYDREQRYDNDRGRGWGRGCNAVKGTFCWLPRAQPMGSNCNCPKDGGVREGYVDR
jgi:hypothetical protein